MAVPGSGPFFVFAALLFGLKPAPFVFTKVLRPFVTHLRDQGIRIFLYLDDGTGAANSAEETQRVAQLVRSDLEECDLFKQKSNFQPRQVASVLGHVLDTANNSIHVTPKPRIQI